MARRSRFGPLLVLLCARPAEAEPGSPAPERASHTEASPSAPDEHRVDFQAERVEISTQDGELALAGDVVLRSERFQVTGDELTLSRSPRGIHVEGSGRLAFCRCPSPPMTLGFSAADLAPPTDVLLEDATLRVAGIPVFYSPYLWLRAPTRVGALPPTVAYRGEEGVQIGTGLHVPLGFKGARPTSADAFVHVSTRGGVGVAAQVAADDGRAEVVWDHFRSSALRFRGTFASTERTRATLAGRIDALRGPRALVAFSSLRDGALRMDRARLSAGRVREGVFGLSLTGTSPRGSALEAVPVFGPLLELGGGAALGPRIVSHAGLRSETLHAPGGAVSRTAQQAELSSALVVGPLLAELLARERADAVAQAESGGARVEAEARARISAPLVRRFDAWVHRLEPSVEVAAGLHRGSRELPAHPPFAVPREAVAVLGALETALGVERSVADLRLTAGFAGRAQEPALVGAARARADTSWLRLTSEARVVPEARTGEAFVRAELAAGPFVELGAFVDGLVAATPQTARLFREDFLRLGGQWLSEPGWSGGGSTLLRLGQRVRAEVAVDYDLSRERFLGGSAAVGYRHVCDCLGLSAWGGKRVGRQGVDLALSVELVP